MLAGLTFKIKDVSCRAITNVCNTLKKEKRYQRKLTGKQTKKDQVISLICVACPSPMYNNTACSILIGPVRAFW